LSYRVIDSKYYGKLEGLNWIVEGYVELENTDDIPGTYVVKCYFKTVRGTYMMGKRYI